MCTFLFSDTANSKWKCFLLFFLPSMCTAEADGGKPKEKGKFNFRNPKFLFYDYAVFVCVAVWVRVVGANFGEASRNLRTRELLVLWAAIKKESRWNFYGFSYQTLRLSRVNSLDLRRPCLVSIHTTNFHAGFSFCPFSCLTLSLRNFSVSLFLSPITFLMIYFCGT